jgi:hypothetical protein
MAYGALYDRSVVSSFAVLSCPVLSITGFSNVLLVVVCGLKTTKTIESVMKNDIMSESECVRE